MRCCDSLPRQMPRQAPHPVALDGLQHLLRDLQHWVAKGVAAVHIVVPVPQRFMKRMHCVGKTSKIALQVACYDLIQVTFHRNGFRLPLTRDSLLPFDRGLQGVEDLLHGLADLGPNTVSRYEGDSLGFGIARRGHVCDLVARLRVASQSKLQGVLGLPVCKPVHRQLEDRTQHFCRHCKAEVGLRTCCNCSHWGECPSKRLAARNISAA